VSSFLQSGLLDQDPQLGGVPPVDFLECLNHELIDSRVLVDEVENDCKLAEFLPDLARLCGGFFANYVVFALFHF